MQKENEDEEEEGVDDGEPLLTFLFPLTEKGDRF